MEDERLKLLLVEKNFDICMDFLARMIEKYGNRIETDDISEQKQMKKAKVQCLGFLWKGLERGTTLR